MKSVIFSCLACFSMSGLSAVQKYNRFENRWDTVPQDSELQYNGFENRYSYQPKGSQLEYNGFENRYEWNSGHNPR
jgi:hypothetical protein